MDWVCRLWMEQSNALFGEIDGTMDPMAARLKTLKAQKKKHAKTCGTASANLSKAGSYETTSISVDDSDDDDDDVAITKKPKDEPLKLHSFPCNQIHTKHMQVIPVSANDPNDPEKTVDIVSSICGHAVLESRGVDHITNKKLQVICKDNGVDFQIKRSVLKKRKMLIALAKKKHENEAGGTHAAAVKVNHPANNEEFRLINIAFSESLYSRFLKTKHSLSGPELTQEQVEKKKDVFWNVIATAFNDTRPNEEVNYLAYTDHPSFVSISPKYCGRTKQKKRSEPCGTKLPRIIGKSTFGASVCLVMSCVSSQCVFVFPVLPLPEGARLGMGMDWRIWKACGLPWFTSTNGWRSARVL
jgi:hypothetical protein